MSGRFITTGTWTEYRKYLSILPPEVEARNGPQLNYDTAPTKDAEMVTRKRRASSTSNRSAGAWCPSRRRSGGAGR